MTNSSGYSIENVKKICSVQDTELFVYFDEKKETCKEIPEFHCLSL